MHYFCCGMLRSGSTWQYNIVSHILESRKLAKVHGFVGNENKLNELLSGPPVIMKLHVSVNAALQAIEEGKAKAVYSYRDLRDVAASLMVRNKKDLRWVMDNKHLENSIRDFKRWTSTKNILIQSYSDIISNPEKCIREISEYLGISLSEKEITGLVREYNIENQKKKIKEMSGSAPVKKFIRSVRRKTGNLLYRIIGKERTKKIAPFFGRVGVEQVDKKTLLHSEHIHKGEIGAFRKIMSPSEIEQVNELIRQSDLKNTALDIDLITDKKLAG